MLVNIKITFLLFVWIGLEEGWKPGKSGEPGEPGKPGESGESGEPEKQGKYWK